jgi:hypothetical protein
LQYFPKFDIGLGLAETVTGEDDYQDDIDSRVAEIAPKSKKGRYSGVEVYFFKFIHTHFLFFTTKSSS